MDCIETKDKLYTGTLSLTDAHPSTSVCDGGKKMKCIATKSCTNYSNEMFSDRDDVYVTVRVEKRMGDRVMVGLVVADKLDNCSDRTCGEKEIEGSFGCGIVDLAVFLLQADRIVYMGDCEMSDPTDIHMSFSKGKLSFGINNASVMSDELAAMTFTGRYRLGVSVIKEGQVAAIRRCSKEPPAPSDAQITASSEEDTCGQNDNPNAPLPTCLDPFACNDASRTPYSGTLTLQPAFVSTVVSDEGKKVACCKTSHQTNYSNEVFTDRDDVHVTVRVEKRMGDRVMVGLVMADKLDHCSDRTCGEKEIEGSIGCGIFDLGVFLLQAGRIFFIGKCEMSDPTDIHMSFGKGKLSFGINTDSVMGDELAAMTFTGRYRLGVSVIKEGQVAVIAHRFKETPGLDAKAILLATFLSALSGSGAPRTPYSGTLTLQPAFVSTIVSDEGKKVACCKTFRSTNYSNEVFTDRDDVYVTVRVEKRMGDRVMVGLVVAERIGNCMGCTCGEKDIFGSIGCGIVDGGVILLKAGSIFFRGNCEMSDPTDIHMSFSKGKLSFGINTGSVMSDKLAAMTFTGRYRLGVSVIKEGQVAVIIRCSKEPPAPSDAQITPLLSTLSDNEAPSTPYSGTLTLRDAQHSTCASDEGKKVACLNTFRSTNYSNEVFTDRDEFHVTVRVEKRMGAHVMVGLVVADKLDHCSDHTCGAEEIEGSIGYIPPEKSIASCPPP